MASSERDEVDETLFVESTGEPDGAHGGVAEVFQDTRLVDTRRNEPWLAAFTLMEDVSLLDLTGKWPTRARASANINSGPRPRCRRWSSTVYDSYPHLMGLYYASSMNGDEPAVVLYERVTKALPRLPVLNRPLSDASLLTPSRGSPPSSATI